MKMRRLLVSLAVGFGITIALVGLLNARAAPLKALPAQQVAAQSDAAWVAETVDSAGNVGRYNSLALAPTAPYTPHISYFDITNGGLKYASWDGSAWISKTVDSNLGSFGGYTSLALAPTAPYTPHISYYDDTYGEEALKYAAWDGSSWVTETVDSAGDVGKYTSLALAPTAPYTPHISYARYRSSGNDDLIYATWDGSGWVTETVDNPQLLYYTSLALDGNGYPHISYFDYYGGLKYAAWDSSSWVTETVDDTGDVGRYNSLALEPTAPYTPHISCQGNNNLNYVTWNGSAWVIETVDSAGNIRDTSLALAPTTPYTRHISYYDRSNHIIKYAVWDGSGWVTETVDNAGVNYGDNSLALAPTAPYTPHISYYDDTNDDLKYATLGSVTDPQLTLDKSVSPSSAVPGQAITYTISFSNTGAITATNVIITDTLSANITGASYSSSGVALTQVPGSLYVWTAPDLLPGDGGTITITGVLTKPLAAGALNNSVTLAVSGTVQTANAPLTVENVAPVAVGVDHSTRISETATLDGSGSFDDNGDALTYGWAQTGGSPTVTLSSTTAQAPTFTAPSAVTVLTFTLTVTDTGALADTDEVVVRVVEDYIYYFPLVFRNSAP